MLWGAFNNASSAMQVFSTDLGSIGQNIANVNTTGYKRQEMMFSTLMSEHKATPTSHLTGLNIFGVQAVQRNLIEAQGIIAPSNTWSDLAINGQGYFMVAAPSIGRGGTAGAGAMATNVPSSVNVNDPGSVMYTRAGAWYRAYGPDSDPTLARSYFLNGQGGYLLGWMADETGAIPANARLEPVYTLAPRPIANNGTGAVGGATGANPSSITMPGRQTTSASLIANLPRDAKLGESRTTLSVQDGTGTAQTVNLDWVRTGPNTYTVTANSPAASSIVPNSWTVEFDANGQVTSPTGDQTVDFDWNSGAATGSINLSTLPTRYGETIPLKVYDQAFNEHVTQLRFERAGTNTWYMFVDPGASGATGPEPLELTFDSDGKLISPPDGLTNLSFSWPAVPANGKTPEKPAGSATLTLDLGKVSQYASAETYIGTVEQDGYGRGTLLATQFTSTGELTGYYDNGRTRTLFKVPVANFVADNALEAVSGTLFRRTAAAGELTISAVDETPGGTWFVPSALENSTVDIEEEFTRMIMTQKAYTMNSQVFRTADEMTTTARDIKA